MQRVQGFLIAVLASATVHAHHSRAMFASNEVVLEGVISKATWRNPHVYFEIETPSADGQATTWVLESGSVSLLARSGWTADTLRVGDRVVATVNPHKEPEKHYAALIGVGMADGTRLGALMPGELISTDTANVSPSTDFGGTWTTADPTNRNGTVGNEATAGPSEWPLTDKGRRQVQSFDVSEDPMFDCVFYGVPRLASSVYSRQWTRESDRIVIQQEQYPITRIIHLDKTTPPENFSRSPIGFSTGSFEPEGTLVVETVAFSYTPWGSAAGLDSSEQKHVIEKYGLSADGLQLHYSHTLIDPEFLTAPVTSEFTYNKIADREYVYETCDLDSARIPLELSSDSE